MTISDRFLETNAPEACIFFIFLKVITYFIEYNPIICELKCARQLCHLFHKFAGKKDRLAYELEVQSLFIEICSCDQLTLPGC